MADGYCRCYNKHKALQKRTTVNRTGCNREQGVIWCIMRDTSTLCLGRHTAVLWLMKTLEVKLSH